MTLTIAKFAIGPKARRAFPVVIVSDPLSGFGDWDGCNPVSPLHPLAPVAYALLTSLIDQPPLYWEPFMDITDNSALLTGYLLDGNGHAVLVKPEQLATIQREPGKTLWLHWDREHPQTRHWLKKCGWVDRFERRLLLEQNTRPRQVKSSGQSLLMFWRILSPDSLEQTHEFLSLRLYVQPGLVLSFAQSRASPEKGLAALFHQGHGPNDAAGLLLALMQTTFERSNDVIESLVNKIEEIEAALQNPGNGQGDELHMLQLRRNTASIRRHLVPTLDLMVSLSNHRPSWLGTAFFSDWNEISNHLTRHLEELALCRERIGFVLDTQQRKQSIRIGRIMYLLTVITGFFLPLSFVTSLLGVNLGGIPGSDTMYGFFALCLLLVLLALIQYSLLRWLRWL